MRDKDNEWIIEHEQELEEKYSGKYVAVVEGRIAAVERTSLEAIFCNRGCASAFFLDFETCEQT